MGVMTQPSVQAARPREEVEDLLQGPGPTQPCVRLVGTAVGLIGRLTAPLGLIT